MNFKAIIAIIVFIVLASCDNNKTDDQLSLMKKEKAVEKSMTDFAFEDTLSAKSCPVQITSSEYRDKFYMILNFHNTSQKQVTGIRLAYSGKDNFNNLIEGDEFKGVKNLNLTIDLKPEDKTEFKKMIVEDNIHSFTKAWITEVAFADGTNWKAK